MVLSESRVSTGIPKLDLMLGGGLIQGGTHLFSGETGTGKTVLSLQFLLQGLMQDETCVYVSLDEKIERILDGARSLGWDLWSYYRTGTLFPVEARIDSAELKKRGKESSSFLRLIPEPAKTRGIARTVLDPISALAPGIGDEFFVREYLREIIMHFEGLGSTLVLTCDIPSGSSGLSRYGFEEFLASGIVVMGLIERQGRLMRTIHIRKMRWSPMDPRVYVFDIRPQEGIVVTKPLEELLQQSSQKGIF